MLSIEDVLFSSNLLENFQSVTLLDMLITLVLSFGMGMFIFFVYGRIYQGAMYSGSFAVTLVGLTMIAAALILAVTSNVVLSLGMVGALSIVRFRTAIKDPMEILFLFWSIETGIVLATGIYTLAVAVNIAIGVTLLVLVVRKPDYPYILVLKCKKEALKDVETKLKENTHFTVKSRKMEKPRPEDAKESQSATVELDIEITLKPEKKKIITPGFDETAFVDELNGIDGVDKAILVTYNGGYMN